MSSRPLEEVTHGLDPGLSLGPVPRVGVGFFRKLGAIKPRVPMIVTGAMNSWPAMTSWAPEALKARIGDRRVEVLVHSNGANNCSECITVSFREFIDAVVPEVPLHPWHLVVGSIYARRPPRFVPARVARYLHRFPPAIFPDLERDVDVESLVEHRTIIETNIWVAYNGAITKLHFDQSDNLLAIISGRKKLLLFDPSQAKHLYREHYLDSNFNFSKVDPEHVDLTRFPDARRAEYWECILEPGEVLYMPAGYWHHVRSEGFCVSANVWFNRQYLSERVIRRAVIFAAYDLGLISRTTARASSSDNP